MKSIWELAKEYSETSLIQKHLEFSQQVYQELFQKCLDENLDFSLILSLLYSIDSELTKEEKSVPDKGVQSESSK